MNSNFKRSFEPNFLSQFNPIKKVRLENGIERPTFPLLTSNNTKQTSQFYQKQNRPKFKAQHKCNPITESVPKPNALFKARPMPNFANPFVPKHFKHTTTAFQEFNLSCYFRETCKSSTSTSRCDTPESQFGSSFLSQKDSPGKFVFKARPMPDFSRGFVKSKKSREGSLGRNEEMDVDGEQMDID